MSPVLAVTGKETRVEAGAAYCVAECSASRFRIASSSPIPASHLEAPRPPCRGRRVHRQTSGCARQPSVGLRPACAGAPISTMSGRAPDVGVSWDEGPDEPLDRSSGVMQSGSSYDRAPRGGCAAHRQQPDAAEHIPPAAVWRSAGQPSGTTRPFRCVRRAPRQCSMPRPGGHAGSGGSGGYRGRHGARAWGAGMRRIVIDASAEGGLRVSIIPDALAVRTGAQTEPVLNRFGLLAWMVSFAVVRGRTALLHDLDAQHDPRTVPTCARSTVRCAAPPPDMKGAAPRATRSSPMTGAADIGRNWPRGSGRDGGRRRRVSPANAESASASRRRLHGRQCNWLRVRRSVRTQPRSRRRRCR